MRIFVDADSCPVKDEVYRVAKRYGLEVTLVSASWLRVPAEPWIRLEVVRETGGLDAADDWIVERLRPGDIVVSDDILLASRCLAGGAKALNARGKELTPDSIGDAVAMRDLMAGLRESQAVQGGQAAMMPSDRSRFLQTLDEIVQRLRRAAPGT